MNGRARAYSVKQTRATVSPHGVVTNVRATFEQHEVTVPSNNTLASRAELFQRQLTYRPPMEFCY